MKDTLPLADLAHQMIDAALKAGADAADAIVIEGVSSSVDIRNGTLEQAERAEGVDIGIRVFLAQKQAITSSSDCSAPVIATMVERALAMAREAPEDPHAGLADPADLAQSWDIASLELEDHAPEPTPQSLSERALSAETAARTVQGVSQVDGASASYSRTHVHLAASNGFSGGYTRTGHSTSCVAISGEGLGMERDYDGDTRLHSEDLRDPTDIGRRAGERAAALQGARKPATGTFPVLFDERIASSLIGHLMAAANGSCGRAGEFMAAGCARHIRSARSSEPDRRSPAPTCDGIAPF